MRRACPGSGAPRDRRCVGPPSTDRWTPAVHGDVRKPPVLVARGWHARPHEPATGPRALLPRGRRPRRAVRRLVLHRRAHDRDLLPPVLPGPHPAGAQRLLLHHRGRGPGRRLPRLPSLPPRRRARVTRVGHPRRRRRPRHAADRRRRGGALRRPRAGRATGVLRTAVAPPPGRRARRRSARPRPGPARTDGAAAHRDHRPAHGRRRLRGRVRQHPAVQRHRARGVRDDAVRLCGGPPPGRPAAHPAGSRSGSPPAPRTRRPRCCSSSARTPCPASRSGTGRRSPACSTCRTAPPSSGFPPPAAARASPPG